MHVLRFFFSRSPLCSPGAYHRLVGFCFDSPFLCVPPITPYRRKPSPRDQLVPEVLDRLRPAGGRSEGRAARAVERCVEGDFVPASRRRRAQRLSGAARSDSGGYRVKGDVSRIGASSLPHASAPARLSRLPGLHACVAPYRRSMRTSRCSRPRTTVERRYRGSRPASVIRSNRAAALAMTALVSMRASSAPMHWCTPCPNAACLGPLRAMSSRSGSLNAASSRFADPVSRITPSPVRMVFPPITAPLFAILKSVCTGLS